MSRRIAALGAVVVLVVTLGLSTANAASLALMAGKLGTFTVADRCATGPLAVTVAGTPTNGTYTQVSIANVPTECSGKAVQLTLFDASGAKIVEVLGAVPTITAATTVTLTVPTPPTTYSGTAVAGAALAIGGYGVSTTWTGPPFSASCVVTGVFLNGVPGTETAPTTETCTVTLSIWNDNGGTVGHRSAGLQINVKNNSSHIIRWSASTHLELFQSSSGVPLGWSPKDIDNQVSLVGAPGTCSAMPAATLGGPASNLPYSQIIYGHGTATMTFRVFESTADGTTCP